MKRTFKELKSELPFGDRIVIEMREVNDFIIIPENKKSIIGSDRNILEKFVSAYSRGTVVEQAISMEDFTEWPNQGVVVGIGPKVDKIEAGIHIGDTVFLRGPNGVSMKLDGRILRVISPMDIYIVRHDKKRG